MAFVKSFAGAWPVETCSPGPASCPAVGLGFASVGVDAGVAGMLEEGDPPLLPEPDKGVDGEPDGEPVLPLPMPPPGADGAPVPDGLGVEPLVGGADGVWAAGTGLLTMFSVLVGFWAD